MKIGITGATSSIGKATELEAIKQGHQVVRFVREPSREQDRKFNLADEVNKEMFPDIDTIIHLAWDRDKDEKAASIRNLESGIELFSICKDLNIKIVFLSTFSASPNSASLYGRTKYALEEICHSSNGAVLRAGIIWGGEWTGILKSIKTLSEFPVVCPHISPEPRMYHSYQNSLAAELVRSATQNTGIKVLLAANMVPIQLSMISHAIRRNLKSIHIKVSLKLIIKMTAFFASIKMPLPFSPDSFRSLLNPVEKAELHPFSSEFSSEFDFLWWIYTKK